MRWRYLIAAGCFIAAAIAYYSPAFNLHEVYARWAFDQGVNLDQQGEFDKAIAQYDRRSRATRNSPRPITSAVTIAAASRISTARSRTTAR